MARLKAWQEQMGIVYDEDAELPPALSAAMGFDKQFAEANINIEYD